MRDRHAQGGGDQWLVVAIGHGQLTILREHKSISSARWNQPARVSMKVISPTQHWFGGSYVRLGTAGKTDPVTLL
jgi:hypothetical protein